MCAARLWSQHRVLFAHVSGGRVRTSALESEKSQRASLPPARRVGPDGGSMSSPRWPKSPKSPPDALPQRLARWCQRLARLCQRLVFLSQPHSQCMQLVSRHTGRRATCQPRRWCITRQTHRWRATCQAHSWRAVRPSHAVVSVQLVRYTVGVRLVSHTVSVRDEFWLWCGQIAVPS